mgnify:CR=1 FL=1
MPDREVLDRLMRIETKLDNALSEVADHENRLRALEQSAISPAQVEAIAARHADQRQRRLLGWLSLIVTAVGIGVGALVSIAIAVL